jgi:hypothetical protein
LKVIVFCFQHIPTRQAKNESNKGSKLLPRENFSCPEKKYNKTSFKDQQWRKKILFVRETSKTWSKKKLKIEKERDS